MSRHMIAVFEFLYPTRRTGRTCRTRRTNKGRHGPFDVLRLLRAGGHGHWRARIGENLWELWEEWELWERGKRELWFLGWRLFCFTFPGFSPPVALSPHLPLLSEAKNPPAADKFGIAKTVFVCYNLESDAGA